MSGVPENAQERVRALVAQGDPLAVKAHRAWERFVALPREQSTARRRARREWERATRTALAQRAPATRPRPGA